MAGDQNKCVHEWHILTPDKKDGPGVSVCNKCDLWLYHSSRLQLEMNQHVFGFQRRISVVTIGISVISLLISMLALGVTAASYFSGYRSKWVCTSHIRPQWIVWVHDRCRLATARN